MTASVKSPSKMPTTDRLAALRLQLVTTEMSLRVGQRIRKRREELGIRTQRALADLIPSPTVTNQTVNKWETGAVEPSPRYKALLAEALEVDVAYFIAEEPRAQTPDLSSNGDRLARMDERLQRHAKLVEQRLAEQEELLGVIRSMVERLTPLLPGVDELGEESDDDPPPASE
jgi:transcriptional regulator with XRE-family HTH domain